MHRNTHIAVRNQIEPKNHMLVLQEIIFEYCSMRIMLCKLLSMHEMYV